MSIPDPAHGAHDDAFVALDIDEGLAEGAAPERDITVSVGENIMEIQTTIRLDSLLNSITLKSITSSTLAVVPSALAK